MVEDVLQFAAENVRQGKAVAMLTVTATRGSSPASPGQMMAVAAGGATAGTVGGGASEYRLVQRAIEALQGGETTFSFSFDHGDEGMVCGGGMEGFGNVLGGGLQLVLFGGGHVAQQIAPLALTTGFFVTVVEDRAELADAFEGVRFVVATPGEYKQSIALTPNTYVVICTRGHRTDDDALRFCLPRPHAYLGMIGSKKKVTTLFDALRKEGMGEEELRNIYAPVGLNIASGSPAEIAVSVVAEMLLVKNNGTPTHKKML